ncbi:MAG: NADH-quinone oxidoreductase subunit A [Armatimonadota bacterium]|nr:MAG: NADH-quinone oxidoreductase subunit A [Armatimonadota bacterium]
MSTLIVIGVFTFVAILVVGVTLAISHAIAPRMPTPVKGETYECGAEVFTDAWRQQNLHVYIFALLFVVFDVELALLAPVALVAKSLNAPWLVLTEVALFILILGAGLLYAWRRGALTWE